jgi:hypothetical protein
MIQFLHAWRRIKVSPVLHSARTLRVRQHLTVRMQNRAFCLEIMQKICLTCGALFAPARAWQKYCQPKCCHNSPDKKLTTQKFQQSRRDLINKIKTDQGCVQCGYNAHPAALDFNHVRGAKLFGVSQDPKVAWHKLLAEIDKCEILCANCHRIHTHEHRHWITKRKGVVHG